MLSEKIIYHESTEIEKHKEIKKIKNFVVLVFRVFVIDSIIDRDFTLWLNQKQVLLKPKWFPS